jgi:hypothetical protein
MKEKLLVAPDARAVLEDPVVRVTFLGAVWVRNGLPAVENWISMLINWSSLGVDDVADDININMDVSCFSSVRNR